MGILSMYLKYEILVVLDKKNQVIGCRCWLPWILHDGGQRYSGQEVFMLRWMLCIVMVRCC